MARAFGSGLLLLTLVVIAWMMTVQQSPSSRKQQTREVDQAQAAANGVAFQQARAQLDQQHALNGTCAGTSVAGFGFALFRADESTYCIQNTAAHFAGPGGV